LPFPYGLACGASHGHAPASATAVARRALLVGLLRQRQRSAGCGCAQTQQNQCGNPGHCPATPAKPRKQVERRSSPKVGTCQRCPVSDAGRADPVHRVQQGRGVGFPLVEVRGHCRRAPRVRCALVLVYRTGNRRQTYGRPPQADGAARRRDTGRDAAEASFGQVIDEIGALHRGLGKSIAHEGRPYDQMPLHQDRSARGVRTRLSTAGAA